MQEKKYICAENFSKRLACVLDKETQTSASKRLKCSQGLISKYLRGEIPEAIFFLLSIASEYKTDLHWLITGEIFNPQKRTEARFQETYSTLLKEHKEAGETVESLESRRKSGQPLTPQEEQELITAKGRFRVTTRRMENFMQNLEDAEY